MYSNYHLSFDMINNLLRERSGDMKILPEKSLWALAVGNMIFYRGEYIFISLSQSCKKCITVMFATKPYRDPCCYINHTTRSGSQQEINSRWQASYKPHKNFSHGNQNWFKGNVYQRKYLYIWFSKNIYIWLREFFNRSKSHIFRVTMIILQLNGFMFILNKLTF